MNDVKEIEKAYDLAVEKLAKDMPLIQHGSGDVPPSSVLPSTSKVLATLTAQFISNLVDAALDAQTILCDSDASQPQVLPPPRFPRQRKPPIPPPLAATMAESVGAKKRRRRADDDFWDEPVVPKLRTNKRAETALVAKSSPPSIDDWVGVAGVDLLETSRSRSAYVRGPHALSTQSFVFPVCHDSYAYNRVLEVQASKRSLEALFINPALTDLVRTEGRPVKKKKKDAASATEDPEDEQDEDASEETDAIDGPMWPGLEAIFPVHRSYYESLFKDGGDS